ncbi:hypothetical protein LOK49_LG03G03349 [Camellia lanceoleosa]|uniref:Uncharacterized protein n=1 Tax=Camellia lanceoleosa TaxID=1840588 RepID=A0ACC0ICI7_9ERIC|nr:hypothetical protein LOK49_LG03G03349 [Camellia lanceoleosa]
MNLGKLCFCRSDSKADNKMVNNWDSKVRCYIVNQKRLAEVLPCQVHWYKERTLIVYPNFYLCSIDVQ